MNEKEYHSKRNKEYRHTLRGLIFGIYSGQKASSKQRGHDNPSYSREWFYEWFLKDSKCMILYERWVESRYKKDLTPSVDRINHKVPYTKDNIQIMTWRENAIKAREEIDSRKIGLFVLSELYKEFSNINEATKITGRTEPSIRNHLEDKRYVPKKPRLVEWRYV